MKEVIEEIVEVFNYKIVENHYTEYEGFVVKTNLQDIFLLIDNGQCCCEEWGYFITNEDIEEFVGSELLSIDAVDSCLNPTKVPYLEEGDIMYINIQTSSGTLQFTAYNSHNGYYGHVARVICNQINIEEVL